MAISAYKRRCGKCDQRDDQKFVRDDGIPSPVCGDDNGLPCAYIAHFGCAVPCDQVKTSSGVSQGFLEYAVSAFSRIWRERQPCPLQPEIKQPDCFPETETGNVLLRKWCDFEDDHIYFSMQRSGPTYWRTKDKPQGVPILDTDQFPSNWQDGDAFDWDNCCADEKHKDYQPYGCTWLDQYDWNPDIYNQIKELTEQFNSGSHPDLVGWTLDLQAYTLNYQRNRITYAMEEGVLFDPFGPNNMKLTTVNQTKCFNLPPYVCVTPAMDRPQETDICNTRCGKFFETGYTPAERCACCDPYCQCVPGMFMVRCEFPNSGAQSCPFPLLTNQPGFYCAGPSAGYVGVNSPDGPTRQMCCDVTSGPSGGPYVKKQICVAVYCSGGVWFADWYCEGVFLGTSRQEEKTCCPLTAYGYSPPISCFDSCRGCWAIGTTISCDAPFVCCDPALLPATLNVHIESTCLGTIDCVLTEIGPETYKNDSGDCRDPVVGLDVLLDMSTYQGKCAFHLDCVGGGGAPTADLTVVSCDPFYATASFHWDDRIDGCCPPPGTDISVIISA